MPARRQQFFARSDEQLLAICCIDPAFDNVEAYLDAMAHDVAAHGYIQPEQIFPENDYHNGHGAGTYAIGPASREPSFRPLARPTPDPGKRHDWPALEPRPRFIVEPGFKPAEVNEVIAYVRATIKQSHPEYFDPHHEPWSIWSCTECPHRMVLPTHIHDHICYKCNVVAVRLARYVACSTR